VLNCAYLLTNSISTNIKVPQYMYTFGRGTTLDLNYMSSLLR
jgi:hypothetical protein